MRGLCFLRLELDQQWSHLYRHRPRPCQLVCGIVSIFLGPSLRCGPTGWPGWCIGPVCANWPFLVGASHRATEMCESAVSKTASVGVRTISAPRALRTLTFSLDIFSGMVMMQPTVSPNGCTESQPNARVARRGFNERVALFQNAPLLSIQHHP